MRKKRQREKGGKRVNKRVDKGWKKVGKRW